MNDMKKKEVMTIGGYWETENFFEMDQTEFLNYCSGLIIIAIGKGEFRVAVHNTIDMANARGIKYHKDDIKK